MNKDEKLLKKVTKILDTTPEDLVRTHFARIFATCYPLYYTNDPSHPKAQEVCENFIRKYIDEPAINVLIPSVLNDVLFALLDELSFANNADPPRYTQSVVKQILEHLAKGWDIPLHDLLYRSRHNDRIQRVIMRLNAQFAAATRPAQRTRLLNVFNFFISCISERIVRASILRDVILTILRMLHFISSSSATILPTTPTTASLSSNFGSPSVSPANSFVGSVPPTSSGNGIVYSLRLNPLIPTS